MVKMSKWLIALSWLLLLLVVVAAHASPVYTGQYSVIHEYEWQTRFKPFHILFDLEIEWVQSSISSILGIHQLTYEKATRMKPVDLDIKRSILFDIKKIEWVLSSISSKSNLIQKQRGEKGMTRKARQI